MFEENDVKCDMQTIKFCEVEETSVEKKKPETKKSLNTKEDNLFT
jgi:hypothetical protein